MESNVSPRFDAAHSPIYCNHGDAQQWHSNVAILQERNYPTKCRSMCPSALNETECIEGQNDCTKQTVGYTQAKNWPDKWIKYRYVSLFTHLDFA